MKITLAIALALLAGPALTQKKKVDWKLDPYTKGDPAAMKRAGYVSFAFPWGRDVDKVLSAARILWVETAHFQIGSSLQTMQTPRVTKSRRRTVAELKELKKSLPTVKPTTRRFDRWLHLHLYAARLERLYTEMQELLGVTDASFPKKGHANAMGQGPYLGMSGKYCVLLLQETADMSRYRVATIGRSSADTKPFYHNFPESGSLLYCTCFATEIDTEDPAHVIHGQVLFHASRNLLKGFRHYEFDVPAWLGDGIANVFVRALDPTQFEFSAIKAGGTRSTTNARWAANSRRLVKNGFAAKASRLCIIPHASDFTLNDHMCSWSRIDFLRTLAGGEKLARFLREIKAPLPRDAGKLTGFDAVLKAQERALRDAFGMSFDDFDAAWGKFALDNYPRK